LQLSVFKDVMLHFHHPSSCFREIILFNTVKEIVHPKIKILSSFSVLGHLCIFFPPKILQNIFLCVQQNKDIHTSLEQHEGEEIMTEFSFLGELSPFHNLG